MQVFVQEMNNLAARQGCRNTKFTNAHGLDHQRPVAVPGEQQSREQAGRAGYRGELSLEESLQHFERGIQLTRSCQQALKDAEQKVEMLLKKNGQEEVVAFDSETG